jgi:hypothetical protein
VTVPALFAQLARRGAPARPTGASVATLVAERYAALPLGQPWAWQPSCRLACRPSTRRALPAGGPPLGAGSLPSGRRPWLEAAFAQLDSHVSLRTAGPCAPRNATTPQVGDRALPTSGLGIWRSGSIWVYGADWMTASDHPAILRFAASIAAYNGQPHEASNRRGKTRRVRFGRVAQARQAGGLGPRPMLFCARPAQPIP